MTQNCTMQLDDCDQECWVAIAAAQEYPDATWIVYSSIAQRNMPDECVCCSSSDIKPVDEPKVLQDARGILLIEAWGCDSCGEPQFNQVTVFTCPRLGDLNALRV